MYSITKRQTRLKRMSTHIYIYIYIYPSFQKFFESICKIQSEDIGAYLQMANAVSIKIYMLFNCAILYHHSQYFLTE